MKIPWGYDRFLAYRKRVKGCNVVCSETHKYAHDPQVPSVGK